MIRELFFALVFAIQFLTIIPLFTGKTKSADAKYALIFFPLVGYLIGVFLFVLWVLLSNTHRFSPLTVALLIFTAELIITGALHLDGLADTFDALLSPATSSDKKLNIMKDSRIGVMGAAALVLTTLMKIFLILELLKHGLSWALIIYPAIGRWSQVISYYKNPYLRQNGIGYIFSQNINNKTVIFSSVWLLPCLFAPHFYIVFLFQLFLLLLYLSYINKKIGGITGDIVGSVSVLSEIFLLFGFILFNP